jgi:lysozyme
MREDFVDLIIIDEGFRGEPYLDTVNKWTVGIGRNLDDKGLSVAELRSLFSRQPMTRDFARLLLSNDVEEIEDDLRAALPWFDQLDEARQYVLVNMGMMGVKRLMGFKLMLAAMQIGDWQEAARELMSSKYATQVGKRAERLANVMRTGTT